MRSRINFYAPFGAIAALFLGACASETTLYSQKYTKDARFNVKKPFGPVYYLPYTVLEIEAGPCVVADTKKTPAPKKASTASAPTTNISIDVKPTATSTATAGSKPDATTDNAPKKPKKCDPKDPSAKYGFKVTSRTLPDYQHAYQSGFSLANFSSDEPNIQITASGLLNSVTAVSKDESREAIVQFGESFGTLFGSIQTMLIQQDGIAMLSQAVELDSVLRQVPKPSFKVICPVKELTVTAMDCEQVSPIADGTAIAVKLLAPLDAEDFSIEEGEADELLKAGLVYRSRIGTLVSIAVSEDNSESSFATTTLVLPVVNPEAHFSVSAIRRPFVKSETTLTFDNGVLVGLKGDYPSTGGAIVSLPADFIGAIFSGIGNALDFQSENTANEAELIQAQVALLEAQAALEEARAGQSVASDTTEDSSE